ncbi:MAG TPA: hypothetical protein VKY65_19800 [Alphaproteobacteria bacterium]|nr:hypothetical protein [Alphaproteobacteria bacterium]
MERCFAGARDLALIHRLVIESAAQREYVTQLQSIDSSTGRERGTEAVGLPSLRRDLLDAITGCRQEQAAHRAERNVHRGIGEV